MDRPDGTLSQEDAERSIRISTLIVDVVARRSRGEVVPDLELLQQHSDLLPELSQRLRALSRVEHARAAALPQPGGTEFRSEELHHGIPGYRFIREIHRGGQGVVFEALQESTQRRVAIKVTHGGWTTGSGGLARLRQEVRFLSRLQHPNIVTVFDSGISAGMPYFVMDFIDGLHLDQYAAQPGIGWRDKLVLMATICDAVHAAHLRGVIHRDLKPGNICVNRAGTPFVLDFGLARFMGADATMTRTAMTLTGQFVGSLPWAAPEQAVGRVDQIDVRTDVYALGAVLYQILTGRLPFDITGTPRELLTRIEHSEPQMPERALVPRDAATIAMKCLRKSPPERYQSAKELADDLRSCLRGDAIVARRDSTAYVAWKFVRRRWLSLSVAASFLLLLSVSTVVSATWYLSAERARGEATERLYESLIAQARSVRQTGGPGQRIEALRAVQAAAAIRPSFELRNEAIAAMKNWDLAVEHEFDQQRTTYTCAYDWTNDILAYCRDQRIVLFDVARSRELPGPDWIMPNVSRLDFSSDGHYLSAIWRDVPTPIRVWDLWQSKPVELPGLDCAAWWSEFSPDGHHLAVAFANRSVSLFDLQSAREIWHQPSADAWHMTYSPDGRRIAIAPIRSPMVRVLCADTGRLIDEISVGEVVACLSWGPVGRLLAIGQVHTALIWDISSGKLVQTMRQHDNYVIQAHFDPRETMLSTSSWDGTTAFWHPHSGRELLRFVGEVLDASPYDDRILVLRGSDTDRVPSLARLIRGSEFQRYMDVSGRSDYNSWTEARIGFHDRLCFAPGDVGLSFWRADTGRYLGLLKIGYVRHASFGGDPESLYTINEQGWFRWPLRIHTDVLYIGPPDVIQRESFSMGAMVPDFSGAIVRRTNESDFRVIRSEHPLVETLLAFPKSAHVVSIEFVQNGAAAVIATYHKGPMESRVYRLSDGALLAVLPTKDFAVLSTNADGELLCANSIGQIMVWRCADWSLMFDKRAADILPPASLRTCATEYTSLLLSGQDRSVVGLFPQAAPITKASFEPAQPYLLSAVIDSRHPGCAALDVWRLRVVRAHLARLGLDWDSPPYPPKPDLPPIEEIVFDLGTMTPVE